MADVPNLIGEKARRARWVALGVVVAIAMAIAGWFLVERHRRSVAIDRMAVTWSAFTRCLFGEPKPGEDLAERLRLISLGNAPPDTTAPWPARCTPDLDAFKSAESDARARGAPGLDVYAGNLAVLDLHDLESLTSRARAVSLWTEVERLGLPTVPSDERLPPGPATPLTSLAAFGPRILERTLRDRVVVASLTRACTIPIATGPSSCFDFGELPSSDRSLLTPLDTDGKPAFAFAGLDDRRGVYQVADGRQRWLGHGSEGTSRGGAFALIDTERHELVRGRDQVVRTKLPAETASLVGELLTWSTGGHLFVQRVLDEKLGPVVDAGQAAGELSGYLCGAGDTTVYAGSRDEVWFAQGDHWVRVTVPRPLHQATATCTPDAVHFAIAHGSVTIFTCRSTGCDEPRQSPNLDASSDARAAVLGDKVLLVTMGRGIEDFGLWMRVAALDLLGTAHQTYLSSEVDMIAELVVDGTSALVIGRRADSTIGIRFDSAGHATTVPIR